jgi:hypothetical protein
VVKWNVEDTFQWLRKRNNAGYEDYLVSSKREKEIMLMSGKFM